MKRQGLTNRHVERLQGRSTALSLAGIVQISATTFAPLLLPSPEALLANDIAGYSGSCTVASIHTLNPPGGQSLSTHSELYVTPLQGSRPRKAAPFAMPRQPNCVSKFTEANLEPLYREPGIGDGLAIAGALHVGKLCSLLSSFSEVQASGLKDRLVQLCSW